MGLEKPSTIIKGESAADLVFDFQPQKFPVVPTQEAEDFVSSQTEGHSDFRISEIVSDQIGASKLQRTQLEDKFHQEALEKLKEVEEKAYKEAYEIGLIEGEKKALEEKRVVLDEKISHLDELHKTYESLTKNLFEQKETEIIKLVSMVASKIALFEIKTHKEFISELIVKLVEDIQSEEQATVYISQEDYDFIDSARKELELKHPEFQRIKLEVDESIETGGAFLETNIGMIDASIQQRVENIWESLKDKLPYVKDLETKE